MYTKHGIQLTQCTSANETQKNQGLKARFVWAQGEMVF